MENAGKLKSNGGEEGDTEHREHGTKMRINWKDRSTSIKARSRLALKKSMKLRLDVKGNKAERDFKPHP